MTPFAADVNANVFAAPNAPPNTEFQFHAEAEVAVVSTQKDAGSVSGLVTEPDSEFLVAAVPAVKMVEEAKAPVSACAPHK